VIVGRNRCDVTEHLHETLNVSSHGVRGQQSLRRAPRLRSAAHSPNIGRSNILGGRAKRETAKAMSHKAGIYSVRVHPLYKPTELRPLGDFDEQGTSLGTCLNGYFNDDFEVDEDVKTAQCVKSDLVGDEVELIVTHGQSGVAADIRDTTGTVRLHQEPEDTQEIRCGSLLRLPGRDTIGWWAVHVNNNRSAKSLLYEELAERFRNDFDKLKLLVSPCVSGAALQQAVDEGQIETVKLARLDRPTDRRERITDKGSRLSL
jgi:hypothetical protein